ncbi:MAG TPA: energy transducer TonB [Gemmatimonadales bacterium]|jgi:hypothetical protein
MRGTAPIVLLLILGPGRSVVAPLPAQVPSIHGSRCDFTDFDRRGRLAERARYLRGPRPVVPASIKGGAATPWVALRFVVCPDGRVDPATVTVVRTSDARFDSAATAALLQSVYKAARNRGLRVADLVEQTVRFRRWRK